MLAEPKLQGSTSQGEPNYQESPSKGEAKSRGPKYQVSTSQGSPRGTKQGRKVTRSPRKGE